LSGRGLCDELITRPEESYRLCCVVVCDIETSRMGAPYIYIWHDISRLRVKVSTERKFTVTMSGRWANIRVMQYVLSRRREPITKRRDVTPQKSEVIKIWIFDSEIRFVPDTHFVTHGGLVNNPTGINDYSVARVGLRTLQSVSLWAGWTNISTVPKVTCWQRGGCDFYSNDSSSNLGPIYPHREGLLLTFRFI